MPNIIDVIIHGQYQQISIVLDKMPEFIYERQGNLLVAEDDGFFDCYFYERPSKSWEAFAGREFEIPMKDGSAIKAKGQWWCVCHPLEKSVKIKSVGISTIEELNKCYVFCGGKVLQFKLDTWIEQNEPSTDYHKYRKAQC